MVSQGLYHQASTDLGVVTRSQLILAALGDFSMSFRKIVLLLAVFYLKLSKSHH
ncbi:hypothetical protein JCM19239_4654 [Vibrio variabilis]|uniref:Uncharacterized protein n=1 Tax=Vibrio variabilis TaxID=990271 RepID=A0ABQ0J831_9VIBR|nr:hypothetical protein JCM19239_4654 [Vibrio variabilis]